MKYPIINNKKLYTILSVLEMKMRDFFPENFAERVVIMVIFEKER